MLRRRAFLALSTILLPCLALAQSPIAPGYVPAGPPIFFGTGVDGDLSISSGTTTLTRDANYRNVTISGTGKINMNGWRIYVSNKLDISNAGFQAIGSIPTAAQTAFASVGMARGGTGANGGGGQTGVGNAGSSQSAAVLGNGGSGGQSGAGGTGVSAGGAGNTASVAAATQLYSAKPMDTLPFGITTNTGTAIVPVGGGGGSGAGGGGGDGTNAGSTGGAGTSGGMGLYLNAFNLVRSSSTAAGAISAPGGTGFTAVNSVTGNTGGGGGGGGSGGGYIMLTVGSLSGTVCTGCLDFSGGAGGAGGNGQGTGKGGAGGGGGASGMAQVIVLSPPSYTISPGFNTQGTAATAISGTTTGVAGGSGAVGRMDL